jgi:hypothetical protein
LECQHIGIQFLNSAGRQFPGLRVKRRKEGLVHHPAVLGNLLQFLVRIRPPRCVAILLYPHTFEFESSKEIFRVEGPNAYLHDVPEQQRGNYTPLEKSAK